MAASGRVRLAIGTFGLSQDKDLAVADVAAQQLSGHDGIELVERRELEGILKEISLSRSGLVRAQDAVRVGALVRADQFVLGSTFAIKGTNHIAMRLVDARSGAIRAVQVIPEVGTVEQIAREISGFAAAEILSAAPTHKDYLAIGVVQNLGVNNRFPMFPAQLRGYLAAHLGTNVVVLERDVV